MHDSGKRQQFETGAVRDTAEGKPRPDLVSPYAEERIGRWMAKGAEKYDERNWEKGMQISRCVASMQRHLVAFKMGKQDEDHLSAIAVNAQFIMHYQAMIGMGKLPISLDDMPDYEDIIEVKDELPESELSYIPLTDDIVGILPRNDINDSYMDIILKAQCSGIVQNFIPANLPVDLYKVKVGTHVLNLYFDEIILLKRED